MESLLTGKLLDSTILVDLMRASDNVRHFAMIPNLALQRPY